MKVTQIISSSLTALILLGCQSKPEQPRIELPKKYELPKGGWAKYLTPRQLVDTLNSGAEYDVYFIQDLMLEDSDNTVNIPGMKTLLLPEILDKAHTISPAKPIILTCLYGDDSKRVAGTLANYGLKSYYLDGGTYRLKNEMERHGWKLLPRPAIQRK
jgi:rhodanese-related sulfurtransferase